MGVKMEFLLDSLFNFATSFEKKLQGCRVSTESWESWETEQTVWKSHGTFFDFEKSWEIHGIFISWILRNLIWLLLNTLLQVFS